MNFPAPRPGLVIRYSFLWSHEAASGATEGRKDRPCAIVVAVPKAEGGETRVVVVPVTHTEPRDPTRSVLLPAAVKASIGLDAKPSWVCLDEINAFAWPGYDVRTVPGTDRVDYGALPQALFERIRQGVLALHRDRRARMVGRD